MSTVMENLHTRALACVKRAMDELPDADEDIIELRALRYMEERPWTGPRPTAWERLLLVPGPLE